MAGFQKAGVRACIEPGDAAPQRHDAQLTAAQVFHVHIRDFQLAPGGRFHRFGDIYNMPVVKIQAGHSIVALGTGRLFLDAHRHAFVVEFNHAVAFRVMDIVAKNDRAATEVVNNFTHTHLAEKNVVAQDKRYRLTRDEFLADQKCLGNAFGLRLHSVGKLYSPAAAVTEQGLETRRVLRRGDDQYVADARRHECSQRIVDHRLVVNRLQLLAGYQRQRIESASGPPRQDDSFFDFVHEFSPVIISL